MTTPQIRSSVAFVGLVATIRIVKIALGLGSGDGLVDVAFSAPDAPNNPSTGSTAAGSGSAGSGPPAPTPSPDDEPWWPEGFDSPLDFFDWLTWTTLKGFLPKSVAPPIDVLEAGPQIGDTLIKVRDRNQRHDEIFNTDFRGDSHLRGGND